MARALAVLVLAALVAPAAATAHARLVRTVPADGADVVRAPHQVLVEFDDTVRASAGNAAVANTSRRSVLAGAARAHGHVLLLPLRPRLPRGAYTVRWSIVSEDGHREQGVLAFAVGPTAAPPEPVLAAHAPARARDVALRALYYFGLLVASGATVFALLARGLLGARLRRPLAGLLFLSLLVAFVGASGLAAGAASGTRFDVVLEVAVVVALVGAASAALAPAAAPLLAVSGGCALALTVAPALAGHALDRDQPTVLAPLLDVAHTLAAAVWLGGLVAASWLLPRASRDTWERRAVLRRFSSAAVIAVVVVAATGLGRAFTELGGIDHLWTTSYGHALLVKTLLFAALLVLGSRSRALLEQRSPRLARAIAVEIAAIALIVVVVAVLTQLRPTSETPKRRAGVGAVTMGARLAGDRLEEARRVLERRQP
ncbi:MAG TPA: copper resistance protein CopC [Gaiellaceae bacterium]